MTDTLIIELRNLNSVTHIFFNKTYSKNLFLKIAYFVETYMYQECGSSMEPQLWLVIMGFGSHVLENA